MIILGVAISNAFVAFSGSLLAQYHEFADVNMGTGMIVVGLASIIIGETLFGKKDYFYIDVCSRLRGHFIPNYYQSRIKFGNIGCK